MLVGARRQDVSGIKASINAVGHGHSLLCDGGKYLPLDFAQLRSVPWGRRSHHTGSEQTYTTVHHLLCFLSGPP
jgi:hypothetical protein